MGELIDYQIAIQRRRNKRGSWKHARERLLDEVWPEITPSFELTPGGKIFTIGSCFARNIESHLQRLGFEIPMLRFRVPAEEWDALANGILNKYKPPAIFQEVDWAKRIFARDGVVRESDCEAFCFPCDGEFCVDTNLGGFNLVSHRRYFERRCQIYQVFKELFAAQRRWRRQRRTSRGDNDDRPCHSYLNGPWDRLDPLINRLHPLLKL